MPRLELDPFIIAANIRSTRQALDCSREDFSRLLGISAQVMERYESSLINSFPTEDKLELILKLAGVSREAFLGGVLTPEELAPPADSGDILAELPPVSSVQKGGAANFQPRQTYKRSRRSRLIRGISLGVAAFAILLAYTLNSIPWKLNPNAVVYVIAETGEFHRAECTLLAEAEAQGAQRRPLTIQGAMQKDYSPCAVCIPSLESGGADKS